jgi:hypothetical protein
MTLSDEIGYRGTTNPKRQAAAGCLLHPAADQVNQRGFACGLPLLTSKTSAARRAPSVRCALPALNSAQAVRPPKYHMAALRICSAVVQASRIQTHPLMPQMPLPLFKIIAGNVPTGIRNVAPLVGYQIKVA